MTKEKVLRLLAFLGIEVLAQVALVISMSYIGINDPTFNVIIGMLLALAFMAYWDNTREIRLRRLEGKVTDNEKRADKSIQELSEELRMTEEEVEGLRRRVDKIERG